MTTAQEVVAYAKSKLNKKVTVPTNPYGGQCVAFIDHIVQHFSDKNLAYTNAIDCLKKAKSQGLEVIYNDTSDVNLIPKSGDFFVMSSVASDGVDYGHIGVVVSADTKGMVTLEQNIDGYSDNNRNGINDQLEIGGGGYVRDNKRSYAGVTGWFRLTYDKTTGGTKSVAKNVNGDVYSSLITQARPEVFWSGGTRPLSAIKYIAIHGTATTSITGAYSTWLKSRSNMTSANYLVTPSDIMGCVGENYVAWHSGGTGAITNYNSIGVEHINSSIGNINDASTYYFDTKTIDNGAKLVAEICKRLGIVPSAKTIVPHRAVSATACPQTLDMNDYIRRVQAYYNGTKAVSKSAPVRKVSTSSKYKVYKADEVKFVSGCYQIKCNDLVPKQFNYIENGIPVAMVNWVNKDGSNRTDGKDKDFKAGMYFTFAGDETYITETNTDGYNYGYYWRKFVFGEFGDVWLSAWNKNHLVNGTK